MLKSWLACVLVVFSFSLWTVSGTEFEVGGGNGSWIIPKSEDYYNNWASDNRFLVHDTLHFKYEEDSVIEVSEDDYNKCKASHPLFFSNNGDTVFTLDRPGLFFFISGVSGNCVRGQKLIVKVLDVHAHSPSPQSQNDEQNAPQKASDASSLIKPLFEMTSFLVLISLFLLLLFSL